AAQRERTAERLCLRGHRGTGSRKLCGRSEAGGGSRIDFAGRVFAFVERAVRGNCACARAPDAGGATYPASGIMLLYMNTRSLVKTLLIVLAVPFSAVGAIWLLYALGYNMSIGVWVGLIALMGVDAETGVFMLLDLDLAFE